MDRLLYMKNRLALLKERTTKNNGKIQAKLIRKIRKLEKEGSR